MFVTLLATVAMNAGVNWTLLGIAGSVLLVGAIVVVKFRRNTDSADSDKWHERPTRPVAARPVSQIEPEEFRLEYDRAHGHGDFGRAAGIAHRMKDTRRVAEAWEAAGNTERAVGAWVELKEYIRAAQLLERAGLPAKAAKLYEEGGHTRQAISAYRTANKLEKAAALLRTVGEDRKAAELEAIAFTSQGEHTEAAKRYVSINDMERAAEALVRAGEVKKAVEALRRAGKASVAAGILRDQGEWLSAALLFEEGEQWEEAAACHKKLDDWSTQAKCLQNAGDGYGAGRLAFEHGELEPALAYFESLGPLNARYNDAGLFRGQIYEREGRLQEAADAYSCFLEKRKTDNNNKVLFLRAAKIHEGVGRTRVALGLLGRLITAGLGTADVTRWAARLERTNLALDDTQALAGEPAPAEAPNQSEASDESTKDREPRPLKARNAVFPMLNQGEESAPPPAVEVLDRRYKFIKQLGQGGNGVVYQATDRALGRDVVVKFLHQAILPTDVARKYFLREAKTAASLQHTNIVTIYDMGEEAETLFYSMEMVDGDSMADIIIGRGGHLEHDEILPWAQQLGAALDYAHNKQIIHRDIKPGNVMVTNEGVVKLLDFGLAKAMDENPDKSVFLCGTPFYMSPEQIRREFLDHRTDLYSLGCLLYVMYTGDVPFPDGNVFHHHQHTPPPSPDNLVSGLPVGVSNVLVKSVAKDREERYQSASELALALAACS